MSQALSKCLSEKTQLERFLSFRVESAKNNSVCCLLLVFECQQELPSNALLHFKALRGKFKGFSFFYEKKNSKETCKKGGRGKGWGKYLHNHIIIGQTANKFTKTIRLNVVSLSQQCPSNTEMASLLRKHAKWALYLICRP